MILIKRGKKREWARYKGDITVVTRLKIIYIQYFIMSVPVQSSMDNVYAVAIGGLILADVQPIRG